MPQGPGTLYSGQGYTMTEKIYRYDFKTQKEVLPKIRAFLSLLLVANATIRIHHDYFDHGITDVHISFHIISGMADDNITEDINTLIRIDNTNL